VALAATACQGQSNAQPTRVPTDIAPTPTVRSTPLPDAPIAPVLGAGPREITLLFAQFGDTPTQNARRAANDLQQQLTDDLGLEIKVAFVDENDALQAICGGAPRAAWVSPFTYVKAQTQCGAVTVLAVTRGRSPNVTLGRTAEIIARADITALSQLNGQTFCRSQEQDYFTSWVFPNLLMASQGVNPITGLSATQDYPDDLSLGSALYDNKCAAAALPPGAFEDLLIDLSGALSTDESRVTSSDLAAALHVLTRAGNTAPSASQTVIGSNVIPYETLVFAPDSALPSDLRERITQTVESFFSDRADGTGRLNALLDATGIMSVNENTYSAFRSLVVNAGWDMTFTE
jgi:ABC-type phosphate/phosphonate transport system substrate-binding protein